MKKLVDYDRVSVVYDQRYQSGGPDGIATALQQLFSGTQASRILEAGCGTGHWLASLRDCEARFGLDSSIGMITKARDKNRSLRLVQGTAMQLPFNKEVFDLVFCVHALHHFEDPSSFIREARRVLGGGGVLAIIGMDPAMKKDRWYVYDYFPGTYENDLIRYPSGETILRWMGERGFERSEQFMVARIEHNYVGREILDSPFLHKLSSSHLALLTEEAYANGISRIIMDIELAEEGRQEIVFHTRIALFMVYGFAPKGAYL